MAHLGSSQAAHSALATAGLNAARTVTAEHEENKHIIMFNPRLARSGSSAATAALTMHHSELQAWPLAMSGMCSGNGCACCLSIALFDAGVGLNARRIRSEFLNRFLTTYSLRPIGDMGSVFKRFPGSWQVFIEDPATPGRYNLAAERDSRPAAIIQRPMKMPATHKWPACITGDVLDEIINKALGGGGSGEEGEGAGFFDKARQQLGSLTGFMRALTK
ncbi:hypothetical protein MMC07_006562 [Pseudocyphellaria aurata]|nr:hypothetical protein [Pseudocyphellaria aurata]